MATVLPSCSQNALEPLFVGQPPTVHCQDQRGLGIARTSDRDSRHHDLAGPGVGKLFVAPCEHAVEVVDLLFVGRRRAAVFEGAAVPGLELVAKPAVSALQEFIASAPEAEVAVPGAVELVAIAHDGAGLAGGTMGFRTGRQ